MSDIDVHFPEIFRSLFRPARYKIYHGGRGSGKSWAIARSLLIRGASEPIRILCAREFQSSISDSVHKLLSDQIYDLNLDEFYHIEKAQIIGANGTEFRFAGIKTNVSAIKSFEGIDVAWIEEGHNVSYDSWNVLIPTIRKDDSEIICTFNPELERDATYTMFVKEGRPDSIVQKVNYTDNPWFPKVLQVEMEYMKENDPDAYQNIWLGFPKTFLAGAIYAKELRAAEEEKRFTQVPYQSSTPVCTAWDLGFNDSTAIVFFQKCGMQIRVIDYLEQRQEKFSYYIKQLQDKPYIYGTHYLPHDGANEVLGTEKSIADMMRTFYPKQVQVLPKTRIETGINAGREAFQSLWFDDIKCADLIQCLRKYRYDDSPKKDLDAKRKPIHDNVSHGSDAFRYMAMALREPKPQFDVSKLRPNFRGASNGTGTSWMGR